MKLYFNGMLVATNTDPVAFSTSKNGNFHRLGKFAPPNDNEFKGEMDEVRIWDHERTTEKIRSSMGLRLTGNEPGLAALWNFDDASQPGRDASPHHIDGQLVGEVKTVEQVLPTVLYGTIADTSGQPLPAASIEIRREGRELQRVTADLGGQYAFLIDPSGRHDLFVTTGKLSAYRLGFQPLGDGGQKLDWMLTDTQNDSAPLTGPSPDRSAWPEESQAGPVRPETLISAATNNYVLHLDGNGSYVELPPNLLNDLEEGPWKRGSNGRAFERTSRV
jgi:hypothetical protein